jgi:mRNA-degrading endonuclease RelE of RelBE toxin-antitoxin system
MEFAIRLTDSAIEDLDHYPKKDRKRIAEAIAVYLKHDAKLETRRRKRLRPNRLGAWELRIGDFRVFYDFDEDDAVRIGAVGHKEHNDLYIRGKKIEL